MRLLLTLTLLFFALACNAEPTTLEIPGQGWYVKFDAPKVENSKESNSENRYYLLGSSGRFALSLTVETPTCSGEPTADDNLQCMLGKIHRIPGFVKETMVLSKKPNANILSYIVYVPLSGSYVKSVHTHVIFANNGKWGDLHISTIKPTPEELTPHLTLGDHFEYASK